MARLRRAILTDFRNHRRLAFEPSAGMTVITGPNGSGKTNLLEAISLLAPGRGLRQAPPEALARAGGDGSWAVAARIDAADGPHELGTGLPPGEPAGGRRRFRLDGAAVRHQAEIAEVLPAVWLTPQMERLWGEQPSGRRRFLDRLVASLDPTHARSLAAHDRSVQTRNRLLAERPGDGRWLAAAEDGIARHAVAATAARASLCRALEQASWTEAAAAFPAASLRLVDPIASLLANTPARLVEDDLRRQLALSRADDARRGATSVGAHRADLAVADRRSGQDSSLASTGQQKALLVGIVLAQVSLVAAERGEAPLLLLDEPLVHLDDARRDALLRDLAATGAQAILTGTDRAAFAPLGRDTAFLDTGGDGPSALRWPSLRADLI